MTRRKMRLALLAAPVVAGLATAVVVAPSATAQPELSGKSVEYNVLAADGVGLQAVEDAVHAAGGTVERGNAATGLLTVSAPENGFTERLAATGSVLAAAPVKSIGQVPSGAKAESPDVVEKENRQAPRSAGAGVAAAAATGMDPLDGQLWGLTAVRSHLSRTKQAGDKRVLVGVLDTGVDVSHPDIAPNFNGALSRNFTRDIPNDELGNAIDGPCEFRGCVDPADWDDNGHGTHVAGTIGAAANGLGVSGVAPNVSLVNIRGGQDSGFFFLQPVVDAMTYAGDAGIDVVNMSFFVDPWLYNCQSHPADTPAQQAEQRLITTAISRAMNYAFRKGVTQVVALGNQHSDLGNPQPDAISPNFPLGTAHDPARQIDNATCLSLPVEGPHSIGVASFGPSQKKADYSNYGEEQISVSAPGGFFRDFFGTPQFRTNENLILSAYPKNVGIAEGNIDANGNITPAGVALGVQRDCQPGGAVCGYYQFLQGTSMAAPHASGVSALIVSQYGRQGGGGLTMHPDRVQAVLEGTAFKIACPNPRTVEYLNEGRDASFTATCTGGMNFNGFYGHGSVDAWAAVTRGRDFLG